MNGWDTSWQINDGRDGFAELQRMVDRRRNWLPGVIGMLAVAACRANDVVMNTRVIATKRN